MKLKQFYEIFSLMVGFSAVLTLIYFLIRSPYKCTILFEPIPYIRIPEIIIGLIVLPYYFGEFNKIIKNIVGVK